MDYTYPDIAKMIDHSLLNPALTANDLEQGIQLALAYDVASVCILPYFLHRCADRLRGSTVKASTTIGFPHGGHTTAVKLAEASRELFGSCTNIGECEAVCPKEIKLEVIARMNRDFIKASWTKRGESGNSAAGG